MLMVNQLAGFCVQDSGRFGTIMGPLTLGTTLATGSLSDTTLKGTFLIGALTVPPGLPTLIRVTLKAHPSTPTQFDSVYIGPRLGSGDTYDVSAFTQLLFNGAAGVTISGGTSAVSDPVAFMWDKTSGLVVSGYLGVHVGNNGVSYQTGLGANYWDRQQAGNEAATANGTSGAATSGQIVSILTIETNGF